MKISIRRIVQNRSDATDLLAPGEAVLIERGAPRWLLLGCPCGCDEVIPINLDGRSGRAWRAHLSDKHGFSLYPSVWRDTGCGSHFIISRDRIYLFDESDDDSSGAWRNAADEGLVARVARHLETQSGFVSCDDLADHFGEVPWDMLAACRGLVSQGRAEEGVGPHRWKFRSCRN